MNETVSSATRKSKTSSSTIDKEKVERVAVRYSMCGIHMARPGSVKAVISKETWRVANRAARRDLTNIVPVPEGHQSGIPLSHGGNTGSNPVGDAIRQIKLF